MLRSDQEGGPQMTDRDAILKRLRHFRSEAGIEPAHTPDTVHPPTTSGANLEGFIGHLEAAHAEIHRVSRATWPRWVANALEHEGWGRLACGANPSIAEPLAQALPPSALWVMDQPVEQVKAALFHEMDVSLSQARAGIADTGTLVLETGPEEPRTLSLVPPVHIVLFDPATLVPDFSHLLAQRGYAQHMPTNLLLISGPSKTADIQQTLAYGAHGPKRLLVLILEDDHA
ncbi:MAG: lactate utilization protein C [Gammaproteobacteria bacterium]|nr:MAG: lactate utilization protein C [Gammaproteobacteria bacterium]